MDMVAHPIKILAYILLNWNLTNKYLRDYAIRHKFVTFLGIKSSSGNFASRRGRTEERGDQSI